MTRAIIVGGGLGGLHAALALRRTGIEAVVLERAPELKCIQVGIGMVLWPNGTRALRDVGLVDRVAAAGAPVERVEFESSAGEHLRTWSIVDLGRRLGTPAVGLSRGELHKVLASALEPGVLRLGARCVGYVQDASGVTVRLKDGSEERADLLIAADGSRSAIRAQETGTNGEYPPYAGYTLWHAIIPVSNSLAPPGSFTLSLGIGSRFVAFRVDDRHAYWSALAYVPAGGEDSPDGRRELLLSRYADYPPAVCGLIAATPEREIRRVDIFGGRPLSHWGTGRVALLGDAAHPMTTILGQGACMALEDGAALARQLGRGGDVGGLCT